MNQTPGVVLDQHDIDTICQALRERGAEVEELQNELAATRAALAIARLQLAEQRHILGRVDHYLKQAAAQAGLITNGDQK